MKKLIISAAFFISFLAQGQLKSTTHTVSNGETLYTIAEKYNTTVSAIEAINPGISNGIRPNQIIIIPQIKVSEHVVQPKETLFGISKRYNMAIEKLYELNPILKEKGLQIGQILQLKKINSNQTQTQTQNNTFSQGTSNYSVSAGETIYSIAVKNGISVSEIFDLNPILKDNELKTGQTIILKNNAINSSNASTTHDFTEESAIINNDGNFNYVKIAPKETLYRISQRFNVAQDVILSHNPELLNGLQKDMIIKIPINHTLSSSITENKAHWTLNNKKYDEVPDIFILLPVDLKNNDPKNPKVLSNLQKNTFLNITLDFYSGLILALEDIENQNYPVNIKIIDSEENNRFLNIENLKSKIDFADAEMIIGPFFQKNVDALSQSLQNQNTLIISPLSTEKGQPFPNQVHTMPNQDVLKNEMIYYLQSNNGTIVSVTTPIEASERNNFYTKFKEVKLLTTNEKGNVNKSLIEGQLNKFEKNYIILDSENHTTTIEMINSLMALRNLYDIQLVTLNKGNHLDSTDINMQDLCDLKLLFPSVNNESTNSNRTQFINKYKELYQRNPSKYAVRGYDVVLDILERYLTAQPGENIFESGSQQIENKFSYINNNGGIYNNGVFIMEYQPDLTIKEAN